VTFLDSAAAKRFYAKCVGPTW